MNEDKITTLKKECSIAWVWQYLGLDGKAGRICKSPFHVDRNPSFSVWTNQEGFSLWKDHSTGEHGDVLDFYAKARGIGLGVALVELLRLRNISSPPAPVKSNGTNGTKPVSCRKPSTEECKALGQLRGLGPASFDIAGSLGTLCVGHHPSDNELLWWLTDATGHAFEGRTFSGQPCKSSGKKVTALNGSRKDFPVGLKTNNPDFDKLDTILLLEGSADYFAGLYLSLSMQFNFRVGTMLGACCNLCDEAVSLFNGKRVCILTHTDEQGQAAARRWKEQISKSQGSFVMIQPLPESVKDLNDLLICPLFCERPF